MGCGKCGCGEHTILSHQVGGTELDLQSIGMDKHWNSEFGINLMFKDPFIRASIQTIKILLIAQVSGWDLIGTWNFDTVFFFTILLRMFSPSRNLRTVSTLYLSKAI